MKSKNFTQSCVVLFRLILVLTAPLFVTACKKFLDQQPVVAVSEQAAFSDVVNARTSLLGVYSQLAGDNGFGNRLSLMYPFDADDMLSDVNGNTPDNADRDLSRYSLLPTNAQLAKPFTQLYNGIERSNICIKHIPQMGQYQSGSATEQAQLKRMHGEALTLRAIYFFELVKNWGDVPAPFKPSSDIADLNLPKTNRDTIYNHILGDLKTAEDLVPWRKDPGVDVDERFTKGGIKALRARIALFRGGYSLRAASNQMERPADYLTYYKIAHDECAELMQHRDQHTLNPSFQSVFQDAILAHKPDAYGEVMMEVAMGGGSGVADSKLGGFDGPKVNGYGNARISVVPSYFYAFNPLDTRRDVTAAPYTINASGYKIAATILNIYDGKFRRDWITPAIPLSALGPYFGVNWPLIRFSDVLLMFAETENEINHGPTAAAISAFEEVRKRGFGTNAAGIGTTPATYDAFFNAIVDERLLEFGGEGLRKYDLIRWNLLYPKILQARDITAKIGARTAPYANYPTKLYYKNNSADLIFSNTFYAAAAASAPNGYTAVNWTASIGTSSVYIAKIAAAFQPNHNELYPLPQTALDNNPNLKQDYGY